MNHYQNRRQCHHHQSQIIRHRNLNQSLHFRLMIRRPHRSPPMNRPNRHSHRLSRIIRLNHYHGVTFCGILIFGVWMIF